jgi:hypothetical protein
VLRLFIFYICYICFIIIFILTSHTLGRVIQAQLWDLSWHSTQTFLKLTFIHVTLMLSPLTRHFFKLLTIYASGSELSTPDACVVWLGGVGYWRQGTGEGDTWKVYFQLAMQAVGYWNLEQSLMSLRVSFIIYKKVITVPLRLGCYQE